VKLLIDTHVFLWWDTQPTSISPVLLTSMRDEATEIFVSAASVWEVAIKRAAGRLAFRQEICSAIAAHGFDLLPITGNHAEQVGNFPRYHRDPFDRMLVAQATVEGLVLGTQDPKMAAYARSTFRPVAWLGGLRRAWRCPRLMVN
jgi:PIN domain nuclease of toxin-antitoxin system